MKTNRLSFRRRRQCSLRSILRSACPARLEPLEGRTLLCSPDIVDDPLRIPAEHVHSEQALPQRLVDLAASASAGAGPDSGGPEAVDIIWVNRGVTSGADDDRFDDVFGGNAAAARAVVDSVIEAWERVITSFNYALGFPDVYGLTVKMDSAGTSLGASANPTTFLFGKPVEGAITMGRGLDTNGDNVGDGGNWFIDPTPDEHSEFLGTITNAYAGNATVGGPAAGLNDFYTVLAAEMTHTMGITNDPASAFQTSGLLTNTGIPDTAEGGGVGTFFRFDGPSINHLMTSNNAGPGGSNFGVAVHTAGPGVNVNSGGNTYTGAEDTGNAVYEVGRRYLVPNTVRLILDDAYNFDTTDPEDFGTMYSVLNETTNQVTVRGGAGTSADVITVYTANGLLVVSVDVGNDVAGTGTLPGAGNLDAFVTVYDQAEVSSILIEPGDGDDDIFINGTSARVTINAGSGDDFISVGGGDIDSNLDENVSVVGGSGSDIIWMDDSNDGAGGDDYYLTVSRLEKNSDVRRVYYEEMETLTLLGSDQPSSYHIAFLPAGISAGVFAGTGDDSFTVANGDIDTNLDSNVGVHGGGGTDSLLFNDTTDGSGSDTYELTTGKLTKGPLGTNRSVTFTGMQSLQIDGSNQNNTWNILAVDANMPVTLNGGTGNDTFNIADDDIDSDIDSNMTINGSDGDDTINFDDSGDAAGNDTYTVGQLTFSKDVRDFRYNGIEAINLTGSPQHDTFQLNGSPGNTVITLESGQGNDTFNLGNGDLGTELTGFVLRGQGGTDSVIINDVNDTEDDTYTLTSSTFSKTFINGNTRQFLEYAGMESLVLDANFEDNTINIHSTNANTPVTVRGGDGNDTFYIGLNDTVGDIDASVEATGGNGTDALFYNDAASLADFAYTVGPNDLIRDNVANVNPSVENITVNAGAGNNVITVGSNNGNATINGGDGDDTFLVATGLWDTGIQGPVTVNGDGGTDSLFIDDSNDTGADNYNVTATQASKNAAFAAPIDYATIESLQLDANGDANIIQVTDTFDGDVTLRGRGGADQFNVIETFPGHAVTVQGGSELDQVAVNANGAGSAAVQFTTSQDLASLTIGAGGSATLVAHGDRVLVTQALSMTGSAFLDLADNSAIFDYPAGGPSPFANVRALLTSGYAAGAWNGAGINSSVATTTGNTAIGYAEASDLFTIFPATFAGQQVDDSAVLLSHVLEGDADLNGRVNLADFNRLAANFGQTGRGWSQGNFDFNTNVNLADFNKLAANFGGTALPAPPALPNAAGGTDGDDPATEDDAERSGRELA